MEFYINHVKSCLKLARSNQSKLNDDILNNLVGMTGKKTRHFYNNLCSLSDSRYLEIGAWKGSSTISALYKNPHCKATIIDNWSEFGGNQRDFEENIKTFIPHEIDYRLVNDNCFSLTHPLDMKYNIYMYDGEHKEDDQYKAITHFYKYLDPISIVVIDDWNWFAVQKGTFRGFEEVGAKILYKEEIKLTENNTHSPVDIARDDFWNGMAVFVIEKNQE